jgi:type II secretory pathway pseudopilin PulG
MKQRLNRPSSAFTLVEVIVMIVIIALLALFFLPSVTTRSHVPAARTRCMSNLRCIVLAYAMWAEDNGNLTPSQQTVANGGWADFLTNADQGPICWTNYAIMGKDYWLSPDSLICPCDERQPALTLTNQFSNTNVSYFVGVSGSMQPNSILGGDRNLGPGAVPSNGYGYSPNTGKGNDVAIPINSAKSPVSWSLMMHQRKTAKPTETFGYIVVGDGHGEYSSTASFNYSLSNTPPTTNWPAGHFPATPSIRLVFP